MLRDNEVYGMDSDFDRVVDSLNVAISNFDLSTFTSKDIVPLKAQQFWRAPILVKVFRT